MNPTLTLTNTHKSKSEFANRKSLITGIPQSLLGHARRRSWLERAIAKSKSKPAIPNRNRNRVNPSYLSSAQRSRVAARLGRHQAQLRMGL